MRRVTFLEKIPEQNGNIHFRIALWADVPLARQAQFVAGPLAPGWSLASVIRSDGLTGQALADFQAGEAALQAGQLVESVDEATYPAGTTVAGINNDLRTRWQTFQAAVNTWNPWAKYGVFFDDTVGSWVVPS